MGIKVNTFMGLGELMKQYEKQADHVLELNKPIIIRLDGNSFHKLTKNHFEKPFDYHFKDCMYNAAIASINYCQGKIAYVQSDEISILIRPLEDRTTILNNRIQKINSIISSICSVAFYKSLRFLIGSNAPDVAFDCRCFTIEPTEVVKYFIWRQEDAIKNAIHSIIHYNLLKIMGLRQVMKVLSGKNTSQKMDMIKNQVGINLEDYSLDFIRGAMIFKDSIEMRIEDIVDEEIIIKFKKQGEIVKRHFWTTDIELPIFSETDYLDKWIK